MNMSIFNKMNLLILFLYISQITNVLSDSQCGPVTSGRRSSNVCCDDSCSQCGEEYCSYDDGGIGTSEVSEKCCKSYIRREQGTKVFGEPVVYCNITNSAPCIIDHEDMVLFGYKYTDDENESSNNNSDLTTSEIIWLVVGSVLLLGFCSLLGGYVATKYSINEHVEPEQENNDIEIEQNT